MSVEPFAALDRVVARYKRDVHAFAPAAPPDAVHSLEGHLQRPLPPGLRQFLARANGASLFRGTLRVRSASEIAAASDDATHVTLFADGPGEARWAYAPDGHGGMVFGAWDGTRLDPMHATFHGWLASTIAVMETRAGSTDDREALRLDADPGDPWQLLRAGERALRAGRADEAVTHLRRALAAQPDDAVAWQRLGDALAATDRSAARSAWQRAFRSFRLPLSWPGAPSLDPDVLRRLAAAYATTEALEDELAHFLEDRVGDVGSDGEADFVVEVARTLARSRVRRGRRAEARDALADLLARCREFAWGRVPWGAVIDLARVEVDLGHHDDAEALLRRVRREGPVELQGPSHVVLARIAIARLEPWAEEILDDALRCPLDPETRLEALALRVERAVRSEQEDVARKALAALTKHVSKVGAKSALAALCESDVARLHGDLGAAAAALRTAHSLVTEASDPELFFRVVLRTGDLLLANARVAEARERYVLAADGFARHGLLVREGWALVRVARTSPDPEPFVEQARRRFGEADLAAGIAAIDGLLGDPGRSLGWHLDRTAAQTRARYDAQRARPPWERSDADRPERRIGAHRFAIAACSDTVVDTLAREVETQWRAIDAGRGRALDPPVLRFVAAVDLLCGHRSYAAAQLLLAHLFRGGSDGPAWRALQGALARSPNAALADGLLASVEHPQKHTAVAVAAAAEVLGLRREHAALEPLAALAAPGNNPISRRAAIVALGRIGDRRWVEAIVAGLDEPSLAEASALSLLMLGDRRGVDFHGRALADGRTDLSGSPGEIVGRYGGPSHLLQLVGSANGTDERALGALQGLGLMGDPRGIPTLIEALSRRDRRTVEVAAGALQILTGHSEDMDEAGARHRWQQWWETHDLEFAPGVRHRDGKPMDAGLLIERLDHPDPWVRRTSYDELVITTGTNLAFDIDGPWRVQQAHLAAWQAWWASARASMPPGRWYLDGREIS